MAWCCCVCPDVLVISVALWTFHLAYAPQPLHDHPVSGVMLYQSTKMEKSPPSHCKETSSSKSCSHFTRFGTAPYGNVLELHFLHRLDYFKNCVNWAQEPRFCNVSSCLWCSLKFENRWCNYRWKDAQPTSAQISRVRTPRRVVVMNQFRWKEERSQHSKREHRVKRVSDRKLHVWRIAVHRYFRGE